MGTATVSRMLIRSVVAVFATASSPLTPWKLVQPPSSLAPCVVITRHLKQRTDGGSFAGRDRQLLGEPDVTPATTLERGACRTVADNRTAAGFQAHGLRPGRPSRGAHRLRRAPAERSPPL